MFSLRLVNANHPITGFLKFVNLENVYYLRIGYVAITVRG